MARVVYSVPVTELIGSIGGSTFQSNRSGYIVRSLPQVRKKRTYSQTLHVRLFSYISQLYRDLSGANKLLWDAFAIANPHINLWNESKTVDGCRWFININSTRIRNGLAVLNAPPAYANASALPALIYYSNWSPLLRTFDIQSQHSYLLRE